MSIFFLYLAIAGLIALALNGIVELSLSAQHDYRRRAIHPMYRKSLMSKGIVAAVLATAVVTVVASAMHLAFASASLIVRPSEPASGSYKPVALEEICQAQYDAQLAAYQTVHPMPRGTGDPSILSAQFAWAGKANAYARDNVVSTTPVCAPIVTARAASPEL